MRTLYISAALVLLTSPLLGQTRTLNTDTYIDFSSPTDVTEELMTYERALEACQSGVPPTGITGPSGLYHGTSGGIAPLFNGSALLAPDPSPGRDCCGTTGWFGGLNAYDLGWDDFLTLKVPFFYSSPGRPPAVESLPASFKFETMWLQNAPVSAAMIEVVTLNSGQITVRDNSGQVATPIPLVDGHWYRAEFQLTMPPGPGMNANLDLHLKDMDTDGLTELALSPLKLTIPADDLEAALCVMPFANFREWAGVTQIDDFHVQSTLVRSSFESGGLGEILTAGGND